MRVVYKMAFDSAYLRATRQHYYRQRPFLLRLEPQFALTLIPLAWWWLHQGTIDAAEVNAKSVWISFVVWLVIATVGVALTKWGILQRLKRKIEFGTEVTMILSDAGIEAMGQHVSGKWSWDAYPQSVLFPDGILLQRPGVIRWLPDSAIQDGTPKLASELVASKTDFRQMGKGFKVAGAR